MENNNKYHDDTLISAHAEPPAAVPKQDVPAAQAHIEQSVAQRPDYLPEQYWKNGQADIESLASDSRKWREALSRRLQDVPQSPDEYDLSKTLLDDPDAQHIYKEFAHKLGLTKYQTEQLFGDEGTRFSESLQDIYEKKYSEDIDKDEQDEHTQYITEQVEQFGGSAKVRAAVGRMDDLFTAMKNRGVITDDEIRSFKHSTFTTACSMSGFEKVMDYIDNLNNGSTVNANIPQDATGASQYSGMDNEHIVQALIKQHMRDGKSIDRKRAYDSLSFLNNK